MNAQQIPNKFPWSCSINFDSLWSHSSFQFHWVSSPGNFTKLQWHPLSHLLYGLYSHQEHCYWSCTTNRYSSWQHTVPQNLQSFSTRSINWRLRCTINQPCTCSRLTVLWILIHLLHRMPWSLFPDHLPVFWWPISYHLFPQTTYLRLYMSNQQQPWSESKELKNPRTFIWLGYHSRWVTSPLMAPWKGPHFWRKESSWVS